MGNRKGRVVVNSVAFLMACFGVFVTPSAAQDWSGVYVGGHIGGVRGDSSFDQTVNNFTWTDYYIGGPLRGGALDIDGYIAGGHVGYNLQFGSIVLGAEVSYSTGDIGGTTNSSSGLQDDVITTDVDRLFLATARIGLPVQNWLFYVKGGYAGGSINLSIVDSTSEPPIIAGVKFIDSGAWGKTKWYNGYTIGGGLEYKLTNNIIVGADYSFIDLGRMNHSALDSDGRPLAYELDTKMHTVQARLSYKFGYDPVVELDVVDLE